MKAQRFCVLVFLKKLLFKETYLFSKVFAIISISLGQRRHLLFNSFSFSCTNQKRVVSKADMKAAILHTYIRVRPVSNSISGQPCLGLHSQVATNLFYLQKFQCFCKMCQELHCESVSYFADLFLFLFTVTLCFRLEQYCIILLSLLCCGLE